jgi:glutamyl-tRNA synthetase
MSNIRVRFAPSPTGYLHVGGARTAIYNWLFARANQGTFVLRIEDTDRKRYNEQALADLLRDLKWLGLDWDEGVGKEGDFGPYQQSDRLDLYKEAAWELVEKGQAYPCFCTAERLDELRAEQTAKKLDPGYDGHCRNLDLSEAKKRIDAGEKYVIRLKTPESGTTRFKDLLRGDIEYKNEVLDDLVLFKRDGFPTYHLASVVDDHHMQISHVLRGDEWIASTPKHVLLYQAFGWEMPVFCHLPVILAAGGGKLSKRKGATSVGEYEEAGYLPEAMVNFLSLLGWNPGDDREIMSIQELIEAFTLERITPKGVAFDEKKLLWLNGQHIMNLSVEELLAPAQKVWEQAGFDTSAFSAEELQSIVSMIQNRIKVLTDIKEQSAYFFNDPEEFNAKARRKNWSADTIPLFAELQKRFGDAEWNVDTIGEVFSVLAEEKELALPKIMVPVRLAVSGLAGGPDMFPLLALLGKEKVIRRLQAAADLIEKEEA